MYRQIIRGAEPGCPRRSSVSDSDAFPKNPALFGKRTQTPRGIPSTRRRKRAPRFLAGAVFPKISSPSPTWPPLRFAYKDRPLALILPYDECPPPRQIFDASEGVAAGTASRTAGRGDRWRRTAAPAAGSRSWPRRRAPAAPESEQGAARAAARSCRRCCRRASARCRGSWSTTAC